MPKGNDQEMFLINELALFNLLWWMGFKPHWHEGNGTTSSVY